MPKRIIICCDGTWYQRKKAERKRQPAPAESEKDALDHGARVEAFWAAGGNVARIHTAIRLAPEAEPHQHSFYDSGVGAGGGLWERIAGGAFGTGLTGNIQQAYRRICESYEPGDELWFFGWSRGAFTVRSLLGLINFCGLVTDLDDSVVREAYDDVYRESDATKRRRKGEAFRAKYSAIPIGELDIPFLGVWDTVGSVGIPVVGPRSWLARRRWSFHDVELGECVKRACQAVAIDEERVPFRATTWGKPAPKPGETRRAQTVEQCWFAGSHGDAGGSESREPLVWMMERAEAAGLRLSPGSAELAGAALSPVHDAMDFWMGLLGRFVRPIGASGYATGEFVHPSVAARLAAGQYSPSGAALLSATPARRPWQIRGKRIPCLWRAYVRNRPAQPPA